MSILDNQGPQLTEAQVIAGTIKETAVQTFQMMVNSFNSGTKTFWNNPSASPSEIAQALGSDAREIFQLHYMLGQLINNIKPDSISESWYLIGQFTMNPDGTVTIIDQITTSTTVDPNIP